MDAIRPSVNGVDSFSDGELDSAAPAAKLPGGASTHSAEKIVRLPNSLLNGGDAGRLTISGWETIA